MSHMIRCMSWLASLRSHERWAFAAVACVVATFPALVVGRAFDVFPLVWWGVVTAYLGISWLVPGACAGAAAAQWGKDWGKKRPNALGFTVGPAVTVGLLVLVAANFVAFSGEEAGSGREVERRPPIGSQSDRTTLVSQALLKRRTRFGPAIWVMCEKSSDGYCAVTYDAPACQWWVVENVNGVDRARPFDKPSEGGTGTYNEESDSIGCSWGTP